MPLITRCVGSQKIQDVTITTNAGQAHGLYQVSCQPCSFFLNHPKMGIKSKSQGTFMIIWKSMYIKPQLFKVFFMLLLIFLIHNGFPNDTIKHAHETLVPINIS